MTGTSKAASVRFTTKGQVAIENGTPAIARLRGILKRKPGTKSFAEETISHKAAEMALEQAKYERNMRRSR